MNAALSALRRCPLEMFHDICDIHLSTVYTSLGQRFIQKFSRRSDKWLSRKIFLVSGCSPTSIIAAFGFPSPNTVWVAVFQRSHALQSSACSRKPLIVDFLGDGAATVLSVRVRLGRGPGERFMVLIQSATRLAAPGESFGSVPDRRQPHAEPALGRDTRSRWLLLAVPDLVSLANPAAVSVDDIRRRQSRRGQSQW
jgi:hypothetical protein